MIAVALAFAALVVPARAAALGIEHDIRQMPGGASTGATACAATCVATPAIPGGEYQHRFAADEGDAAVEITLALPLLLVDTSFPSVAAIARADASPTRSPSLRWNVTFSEPVTGVDPSDFRVAESGGVEGAAVTAVSGAGASYTVTVASGTGTGALGLDVADDDTIRDDLGLMLGGLGLGNGDFAGEAYAIDRTPPSVAAVTRAGPTPTNDASVRFDVRFSEPVTGVDAGDFALTTSGVTGAHVAEVEGEGTAWTVDVATGTGSGSIRLDVVDDDSVVDVVGNALGGDGHGNGDFEGAAYIIDKAAPTMSSARIDSPVTRAEVVRWQITFSEDVVGFGAQNIEVVEEGNVTGAALAEVSGSGSTYVVSVATGTGEGDVRIRISFDDDDLQIRDLAGNFLFNASTGLHLTAAYTIDRTAPSLTQLQMLDPDRDGRVDQVRATFSESLQATAATAPWTLTDAPSGGALAGVSRSGSVVTLTLAEGAAAPDTTVGAFRVALAAASDGVRDAAGNEASFGPTAPDDRAAPAPAPMTMRDADEDGRVDSVAISFSEPVEPYAAGTTPWTLSGVPSGGALAGVTVGADNAQLALTEGASAPNTAVGSFRITLASNASGIRDAAGNLSSWSFATPADGAAPVPVAAVDSDSSAAGDGRFQTNNSLTVTFSESVANAAPTATTVELGGGTGAASDSVAIPGLLAGAAGLGRDDYIAGDGSVATFAATLSKPAATQVRVTLGACSGACAQVTQAAAAAPVFLDPAGTIADPAGNSAIASAALHTFALRLF